MSDRRAFFIATEGIPFLLGMALVAVIAWQVCGAFGALLPFALTVYLFLIFRDPPRTVAPAPLGVVCPVDGKVLRSFVTDEALPDGGVRRIVIRVSSFGTYTARAPVEGKIMDLGATPRPGSAAEEAAGLWVLTDEGRNVVLRFRGNRFGIAPRSFLSYGERVGQGQRCACLRLTKYAEVDLPAASRVLVTGGQRVSAGRDLLATLPQTED